MSAEPCPTCTDCPTCGGRRVVPVLNVCQNETCGRSFRTQDGAVGRNVRYIGVMYCSRRCAVAQTQRRLRLRAKATS